MPDRIRIMPHEAVPLCGSFEESVSSVAVAPATETVGESIA
jgi:hypothetical protein